MSKHRSCRLLTVLLVFAAAVLAADAQVKAEMPADDGRSATDRVIEDILAGGDIVQREDIGKGVTHPLRLTLKRGEQQIRAIYKSIDSDYNEVSNSDRLEMTFSDRHIYEVAAYRLDRLLGLGLVPPAVPRTIDGTKGTVQYWIEDSIDLETALTQGNGPRSRAKFLERKAGMLVLDILIFNTDRNHGNVLVTTGDDGLYLIDHSRAFRLDRAIPRFITDWDLAFPPALTAQLQRITRGDLDRIFAGLLSKAQIAAVEKRRVLLVQKLKDLGKL